MWHGELRWEVGGDISWQVVQARLTEGGKRSQDLGRVSRVVKSSFAFLLLLEPHSCVS